MPTSTELEYQKRVKQLEGEVARLKEQVAQLAQAKAKPRRGVSLAGYFGSLLCCASAGRMSDTTAIGDQSDPDKRSTRALAWAQSFVESDPRRLILEYFRPGDSRGPRGLLKFKGLTSNGKPSEFFSVWRPTSMDAVRMLMRGDATGKSLNIKGKSAKQGIISGFVPFVQIHKETDKGKVPVPPIDARVRVFYRSKATRELAYGQLETAMQEMVKLATTAQMALAPSAQPETALSDEVRERHMVNMSHRIAEPKLRRIDDTGFGIDMPQRVMWEVYVMRQDITRVGEWESGRDSEPDYMDLNNQSVRHVDTPRVVVYQWDAAEPMNPRGLLIAYEEAGRVLPVASDFDAFTIGSKGLEYPDFPSEQVGHLESLVRNIERVLATPSPKGWTGRWLEVLKGEIKKGELPQKMITQRNSLAGNLSVMNDAKKLEPNEKDQTESAQVANPEVKPKTRLVRKRTGSIYTGAFGKKDGRQGEPRYGFGDELHYSIVEHAAEALKMSGAVRHAAECYNFYWPQDLDDELLVVWEGFSGTPWRYFNPAQLRNFLCNRAKDGWVFPLNPKWLLCDKGWYEIFEALESTEEGKKAISAQLPEHIRKQVKAVHAAYPEGFKRVGTATKEEEAAVDMAIVQLQLERYKTLQRAKLKLKSILMFNHMALKMERASASSRPMPNAAPLPQPGKDDDQGLAC